MDSKLLGKPVKPDWEGFLACLQRQGTPARVHHIELFLDWEIEEAICERFRLLDGLDCEDAWFQQKRKIAIQRFLGYDYVRQGLEGLDWALPKTSSVDTAGLAKEGGRSFVDECKGPITNWDEFDAYLWPDAAAASTRALEWYEQHLPDDMCIVGSGSFAHFAEHLMWLMGYETLCYALYDDRDLVKAIAGRLMEIYTVSLERILQFSRVRVVWGSDDMGFKTGPMIGVDDLREFVLPGHTKMAAMSHAAGHPYLLHSCGNLSELMDDLMEDVGIDGKHSFEDTIEDVREEKATYGQRIALLGGIDVDFLCRSDEEAIRTRVRDTLNICMPGGGYCLGTGNSVANYIPVENYLVMLDEGRNFTQAN